MNEKIIIGVDTGNRCVKTVNHTFVAGIKKHIMKPAISKEVIRYKNAYYTLTSERITQRDDKTENEDYFILSLFAIVKELQSRNYDLNEHHNIHLGVGLPPSHIGRLQDSFVSYFKRNFVTFEYNGKEVKISIEDVNLFPQGYAAIVQQMDKIVEIPKSYIVDIGGYTTDVIMLKNGIPDMSFCESLDFGMIQLYNRIKSMAETEYGKKPDETQIDHVIETGEELYKDMSKRINDIASEYVDEVLGKLYELGVDLVLSYAIFVGGGALRLKEYIKRSTLVTKKMIIPSINTNAAGYEYIIQNTTF